MAISFDSSIPDVIYLDEDATDDALSYVRQGAIEEIITRRRSEGESSKVAGLSKVLIGRIQSRDLEEDELEFIQRLNPIGKLALLREILFEENVLAEVGDTFPEEQWEEFSRGDMAEFDSSLEQTPITEMETVISRIMNIQRQLGDLMEFDEKEVEDVTEGQQILSTLNQGGNIFRARIGEDPAGDFILSYENKWFRNKPMSFPRSGGEYTVLAQITGKFEEGEQLPLINFVDLASRLADNPHEQRRQVSQLKNQLAEAASTLTGREVDPSEFEITHPDIEAKLFAIYV